MRRGRGSFVRCWYSTRSRQRGLSGDHYGNSVCTCVCIEALKSSRVSWQQKSICQIYAQGIMGLIQIQRALNRAQCFFLSSRWRVGRWCCHDGVRHMVIWWTAIGSRRDASHQDHSTRPFWSLVEWLLRGKEMFLHALKKLQRKFWH